MICSSVSVILPLASAADGDELAALAFQPRLVAFERGEAIELNQVLLPQIAHAREFLLDQRGFLGLGVLLRGKPRDLLLQLADPLLQLIFLAEPRPAAQIEQLALAAERLFHVGIVGMIGKLRRHRDCIGAVALGGETRLARIKLGKALGDDGEIGAGHRLVEPDENVARLHMIAVVRI